MSSGKVLGGSPGALVLAQDIYEISATQKHRLGTRCQRGQRVFVYAKAASTLHTSALAALDREQDIAYRAVAATVPAGSTQITLTTTTGDGQDSDGQIDAHELEGGYIVIFVGDGTEINMGILDNTEVTASSHTITITLDGELPTEVTNAMYAECVSSPYLEVTSEVATAGGFKTYVGLPMAVATTTYPYCWLQTWGPCFISPANNFGDANPGTAQYNHALVVRAGGTVQTFDSDVAESEHAQRVGFILFKGKSDGQGAPFMMLQISP